MKVINVSPTSFSRNSVVGGGEKYIKYLTKSLLQHPRFSNADSLVHEAYLGGTNALNPDDLGSTRIIEKSSRSGVPFDHESYVKVIKDYDVVIVHQCLSRFGMTAGSLAKLSNKRVIGFDHGGGEDNRVDWTHESALFFDAFIAQSEFARVAFNNFYNKIETILGPVDTDLYGQIREYKKNSLNVLTIGRILPHKGFENVLKSISSDIQYIIVGSPYDKKYLNYLIQLAAKLEVDLKLLHNLDDLETLKLIREASIYVQPSVKIDYRGTVYPKPELLGLASLEALSCGVPTLVSSVGALPELASLHGCSTYESNQELREFLTTESVRRFHEMDTSSFNKEVSMRYGLSQFAQSLINLMDEIQ